jgi:hypothetical protein
MLAVLPSCRYQQSRCPNEASTDIHLNKTEYFILIKWMCASTDAEARRTPISKKKEATTETVDNLQHPGVDVKG